MPNQEQLPPNNSFTPLNHWAEDDRPREKLMLKGKSALSDAELLAIIMGSGSRNETAVDLAKRILKDYKNNWHELAKLNVTELKKYKGIGEAKAIGIITALEIGRRRALQNTIEKPVIKSSRSAYEILNPLLGDLPIEEFWVLFLSQSNKVIGKEKMSSGGISGSLVDVRMVFKRALELYATGIIVAHNHPSGNLSPSPQDISLTQKLKQAGEILDIQVLDHLIITQTDYFSFADDNRM